MTIYHKIKRCEWGQNKLLKLLKEDEEINFEKMQLKSTDNYKKEYLKFEAEKMANKKAAIIKEGKVRIFTTDGFGKFYFREPSKYEKIMIKLKSTFRYYSYEIKD